MASGDRRHGKEPAAVEEDNFPEGLRVLAVDDDRVCLRVLEAVLRECKYKPTGVMDGRTALKLLREKGEDHFDLVITDVHMPDMDGFQLLELIGLEMDLPVIMLCVNGEKATMYRGIRHGACDYIVKPADIKEIRNLWQHVVRKNHVAVIHNSSDSDDADQRVARPVIAKGGSKSKKCSKKKRNDGEGSDDNRGRRQNTWKKPRVSWTGELHNRFLEVVNRLGVDRVVPKAILQMMNAHNLSRENVASHLQKYRLFLKRVTDDSSQSRPHNIYAAPAIISPLSLWFSQYLRSSSINIRTSRSVYSAQELGHGNSRQWLPHAWKPPRFRSSCWPSRKHIRSANAGCISSYPFPFWQILPKRPASETDGGEHKRGAFLPSWHLLRRSRNAKWWTVRTCKPVAGAASRTDQPFLRSDRHGTFCDGHAWRHPAPVPCWNCSNPWQNNVGPSSFAGSMVGAPLLPSSQVNVILPQINQTIFAPSSSEMAVFQNEQQNQMAGTNINNTTSVGVYSVQMTPLFNMASNVAPMEMTSASFSPMNQMMVNGGSTSSPSPNLQAGNPVAAPAQMANGGGSSSSALPGHLDSSVAPPAQMVNGGRSSSSALPGHLGSSVTLQTQMLNGGEGASGILPVQDDPAGQQASDDQPTFNTSNFLKDIFPSMASQDFNPDAVW